jgi:uncharacterized protein YecT (DUF1311 family)
MKRILIVTVLIAATQLTGSAMPTDTRARYEEEDKQLVEVYKKLLARLKNENPAAAASLRAAERKWIEFRDLECKFRRETLANAGIPAVNCLEELTLQRIKTLKQVREILDKDAAEE